MKLTKKLFAVALAGAMGLSMFATPVFADNGTNQSATDGPGNGAITTNFYKISQSNFATIVNYTWDDLTWTYCDAQGSGQDGWIPGTLKDAQEQIISGPQSHTTYGNLVIDFPEDVSELARQITVTNNGNAIKLGISFDQDNYAGLKVAEYDSTNEEYAEGATSLSDVSMAGSGTSKIFGVYPTQENPTFADNHITGTVTLTFTPAS